MIRLSPYNDYHQINLLTLIGSFVILFLFGLMHEYHDLGLHGFLNRIVTSIRNNKIAKKWLLENSRVLFDRLFFFRFFSIIRIKRRHHYLVGSFIFLGFSRENLIQISNSSCNIISKKEKDHYKNFQFFLLRYKHLDSSIHILIRK
jgi:hypothetical protein